MMTTLDKTERSTVQGGVECVAFRRAELQKIMVIRFESELYAICDDPRKVERP